jgi:hypothetical protein
MNGKIPNIVAEPSKVASGAKHLWVGRGEHDALGRGIRARIFERVDQVIEQL